MKIIYLIITILCALYQVAYCQIARPTITDLQTPVSPGFVLADQTPTSVNRPTNPRGLVANILALNKGGSVEATPYWLFPVINRKDLTFIKYQGNIFPIIQTFSISATSFRSDTASYLSLGGRFHLIRIFDENKINSLIDTINKNLIPEVDQNGNLIPFSAEKIAKIESDRDLLGITRPKFLIEIAGAWLGSTPQNTFEQLRTSRNGIWANILYKPHQSFNCIGLLRYINNKKQGEFSQLAELIDIGISAGYENSKNFSLNAEFVWRNDLLANMTAHRLAAVANYRLNEELFIVGSFGKNFGEIDNIIAILGVSFGLSNKSVPLGR